MRPIHKLYLIVLFSAIFLISANIAYAADGNNNVNNGSTRVLIIQDVYPWNYDANEMALQQLNIPYDVVNTSALANINFNQYGIILIASDQNTITYNNLTNDRDNIASFVNNGGILIAHSADNGWHSGFWTSSFLPGNVTHLSNYQDNIHIINNTSPIVTGFNDTLLSGWYWSTHGNFTNIPAGANIILSISGYPINGSTYIEYKYGSGTVLATLMTIEYPWASNNSLAKNLLTNELSYAMGLVKPASPSPVPLVAGFKSNATTGIAPLTVLFNDTSTGYPKYWNWSFGDNTANVTTQNATHTFQTAGTYNVLLTVANGSLTSTFCGQIIANGSPTPTLNLPGTPNIPAVVRGYVLYNLLPVSGAVVTATGGGMDITNGSGAYGVDSPSNATIMITASYNGQNRTIAVKTPVNGGFLNGVNISLGNQRFNVSLVSGWNLIALPFSNATLHASDIVNNTALGVDMIAVYNSTTNGYMVYYAGASSWKNVPLTPDQGYFVHETLSQCTFTLLGLYEPGHYETVYPGWNLLGWTGANINASNVLVNASLNSSSQSMIAIYNTSSGQYQVYYPGARQDNDFTLVSGEGFYLLNPYNANKQVYIG